MDKITRIDRIVKNKEQKNSKIIAFLCEQYAIRGEGTFFKRGELWINASCRALEDKLHISHSMVNKTLNFLKRENLIKYSYVNNAGYERTRKEEQMCVHFTPKGMKLLVKPLTEHLKPREEKKVDTPTKEPFLENYYLNNIISGELKFKKGNDKRCARVGILLLSRGIFFDICKESFQKIGKLCSVIAPNMSVEIAEERVDEYVYFLEKVLHRTPTFEEVVNIKSMWKFYWTYKWKWAAKEREEQEREEHAERRLLDDRKREYQWLPSSKAMNSIGNVMQNLMEKLSSPRLAVSMRMLQ